jgi:hypothetical protein
VGLRLYDKAGSSRAALAMAGDGEGLGLYDKAGNSRAAPATGGDDVRLELDDKAGKKRVALGNEKLKDPRTDSIESRPVSSLVLFKENGTVVWKVP